MSPSCINYFEVTCIASGAIGVLALATTPTTRAQTVVENGDGDEGDDVKTRDATLGAAVVKDGDEDEEGDVWHEAVEENVQQ